MDNVLERYYEAQFDMMTSEGWKDLCEDLNIAAAPLRDITTASTDNLQNRQGRLAELDLILTRHISLSRAFEALKNGT